MRIGTGTLLDQVASGGNLRRAWDLLNKQNPGSYGVDRVTIASFRSKLRGELASIQDRLLSGSYEFFPVRPVPYPKKSGQGWRPLRIPTIADRVVQKAILLRVEKLSSFRKFHRNPSSFAYVRGRTPKQLVDRVTRFMRTHAWVLESDIIKFFDSVQQERVLEQVYKLLPDASVSDLIKDALSAEVSGLERLPWETASLFPKAGEGLPQGAALSPLFSNVFLHSFDNGLKLKRFPPVRYADDFIVFAKTRKQAEEALKLASALLGSLGLSIPPLAAPKKPSRILPSSGGFEFVGLRFEKDSVRPTQEAVSNLYRRVREVMDPKTREPLYQRYLECERVMSGWHGAYKAIADVQEYIDQAASSAAESSYALLKAQGLARNPSPTMRQRHFLAVLPRKASPKRRFAGVPAAANFKRAGAAAAAPKLPRAAAAAKPEPARASAESPDSS